VQGGGEAVAGLLVERLGVIDAKVAGEVAGVQARAGFQQGGVGVDAGAGSVPSGDSQDDGDKCGGPPQAG
jgi:hypothetical protein